MPVCPSCGTSNPEDAVFCSKCGSLLRPHERLMPPSPSRWVPPPSGPSYSPAPRSRRSVGTYSLLGSICAAVSLFVLPEVFGSVAIVLGAYTWKLEEGNRGLMVLVLGIVFMLVGIYFTSSFALIDLLPS